MHTNFAASNPLLKQMQEGAPVDVFASADQETMDKAQKAQLIKPESRKNFVSNTVVLIVPAQGKKFGSLAELKKAQRIAVGSPESVPVGRYTRDALKSAGLWETLQPSFIYGNSVRQVLDYVARGEVDAGIVYATDAKQRADKVDVCLTLTGLSHCRSHHRQQCCHGPGFRGLRPFPRRTGDPGPLRLLQAVGF